MKRVRFFYWFLRDLLRKYRRFLLIGFFIGLLVTIIFGRVAPILFSSLFQKKIRIGIVGEFSPSNLPESIQNEISYGLLTLTDDGLPQPGIAKNWNISEDGKEITFELGNHLWHSGKEVKATDINYNIKGVTFQSLDKKTIKMILPEPFSPFASLISKPLIQEGLVGVGSFRVGTIQLKGDSLDRVLLIPTKETRAPKKEYRFYKTESLAILGYKRGDIDKIEEISSVSDVSDWPQTSISSKVEYRRIIGLYFNTKDQLFSDRAFRVALAYAVPELSETQIQSPIPKTSWGYSPNVKNVEYDQTQANKLIAQLKLPEDFAGITLTTFPQYVNEANTVAENWTKLGVKTTVNVENSLSENFQILLSAQEIPPDPDQYTLWHSKSQGNITQYTNLKIDKLLEDGRKEYDIEKRKKIYADFQKYLVEDLPAIFLHHPKVYSIIRKSAQ